MEITNEKFLKMNSKKALAKRNAIYIYKMANDEENYHNSYTLINRANRIMKCLNYWKWDNYEKSKLLDLKKVSRCKDLYCSNCRKVKMDKQVQIILRNLAEIFYEKYIKDYKNGKLNISKNKLKTVKATIKLKKR